MAKRKIDPQIEAHLEWLGFVKPVGLVVSAAALVRAGAILDRRDSEGQRRLIECTDEHVFNPKEGTVHYLPDFRRFAKHVLGWSFSPKGYCGGENAPLPEELQVTLTEYHETLRPDFAVRELEPQKDDSEFQLLVKVLERGKEFDQVTKGSGGLEASAHGRMERLLRQTGVTAGLLFNGRALRLLSAPRGESSGWVDFKVEEMTQVAGRPIITALRLLLSERRLLSLPRGQRLSALLTESRKFQNEVSERLAEQVLHGLYELLRGFQAADDASGGTLLKAPLEEDPDEVYRSLLTVILRLVFLLYAEERDMLPEDEVFLRHYSLAGLYERLREDAALYPDTMDQRYSAWAQLLVLFRMIHDGSECGEMRLPKRLGTLFDPDRFKFLEGRGEVGARQLHERIEAPLVSDGTIYRMFEKLLVLDGERLSYRALDVEQIGSVYETMMGFRLETATGQSIAIKSPKKSKGGAATAIDLDALLEQPPKKRAKWIEDRAARKIPAMPKKALVSAKTLDELHAALESIVDRDATPDIVSKGSMLLQPSEERRKSGSHYTPRSLTEPIVRTTLKPIFERLRGDEKKPPLPNEILDLKVCDPAMGSGAFLVEATRQLADELIESWKFHDQIPTIPPDEDEVIFARRLIAQRCIYGVDKNPMAVDLAKVSLWLATLAKDHALTFLNHALRHGDSLVGLSKRQIEAFHWDGDKPKFQQGFITKVMQEHLSKVSELRKQIREADDCVSDWELRDFWDEAEFELGKVRLFGDLICLAFFEGKTKKEREKRLGFYSDAVSNGTSERYRGVVEDWANSSPSLVPFHWEIEFPEVFTRENGGFDAFVGNPPFLGGKRISTLFGDNYKEWLASIHDESNKNSDLVAHFFRRTFQNLRETGTLGLIATIMIAKGDTRSTGLEYICEHGGFIYSATKRLRWPGEAAVVVSILHLVKGVRNICCKLNNREVDKITAHLLTSGGNLNPFPLAANEERAFVGVFPYGPGFVFDNENIEDGSTSLEELLRILEKDSKNSHVIFPYVGGSELYSSPVFAPNRFIIDFGDRTLEEANSWPELVEILRNKVKPFRLGKAKDVASAPWWLFWRRRPILERTIRELLGSLNPSPERLIEQVQNAIDSKEPSEPSCGADGSGENTRVLACVMTTMDFKFTWLDIGQSFDQTLVVFVPESEALLTLLESTIHKVWALQWGANFGSSAAPRYNPTLCFQTFPFPKNWQRNEQLISAGHIFDDARLKLMIEADEGLTKTYNRFNSPDECNDGIIELRRLHSLMDRAVLQAYGWDDLAESAKCEFLLDYEKKDNDETNGNKRSRKKKPWRYRWPDEFRDEVLARLLELNEQRAKEEVRLGLNQKSNSQNSKKKKTKKTQAADNQITLELS